MTNTVNLEGVGDVADMLRAAARANGCDTTTGNTDNRSALGFFDLRTPSGDVYRIKIEFDKGW